VVWEASGKSKGETSTGGIEVNEEKLQKYYARLGIKPLSPAAISVKGADIDIAVPEEVKEKALACSEVEEAKVVEGANGHEHVAEGDIRVDAGDEVAAESIPILGDKVADEVEPRAALTTASVLPLGLLGTKKAWIWILVLVCVAIAGYFLLKWYLGRDRVTSHPEEAVKTPSGDQVRDFLDNY